MPAIICFAFAILAQSALKQAVMKAPRKTVGIVGHPIKHTASPAMHNAAFRRLKMNWVYEAWDVPPARLKTTLKQLRKSGVIGVNITVPHKKQAAKTLKKLDAAARKIGAINTIVFSGIPRGFNTDGHGLLAALRRELGFRPRGKTIAVAGCGGAGQAAAVTLALAGARKLILLNRTAARAMALARRIRSLAPRTSVTLKPEKCHLLINATSLGLKASDSLPLSLPCLRVLKPRLFMDMIYRPSTTRFMRAMKKQGARVANGLEMLLGQGARSFEIWTRRKAPVEIMRRALKKEIYG
jgi:shikimate dehydrogenase